MDKFDAAVEEIMVAESESSASWEYDSELAAMDYWYMEVEDYEPSPYDGTYSEE